MQIRALYRLIMLGATGSIGHKKGLKLMADLALHAIPPSFGTQ